MYKILLLGSPSVGKTSWINRIRTKQYDELYNPTISITLTDIGYKNITCIDTPTNTYDYIDEYEGIMIMCDFNGQDIEYVKTIKSNLSSIKPIILVINKLDIDVEKEFDFQTFSKELGIDAFIAISVKDEYNLYEPFDKMIQLLKVNSDDFQYHFIRDLLLIMKENQNISLVKINYIILIYSPKYYKVEQVQSLIKILNDLMINIESVDKICNYLILN